MVCLVLILFLLTIQPDESFACTSFVLKGGGRQYLAKNFDWHCGKGFLLFNPKSVLKNSFSKEGDSITWISRHSSITFNQFGVGFPLGGMNSAGLIIEELNAPLHGKASTQPLVLNEFQWIQYQLDNHSHVAEVINSTETIGIKPLIQNLHYICMDIQGNVAIIEFINGELKFFSGGDVKYNVLSNNLYGNSLKYLENFVGFGGDLQVPKSRDSQSRFVIIADHLKHHSTEIPVKDLAFELLSGVSQKDTQWSIVYDNLNLNVFFKETGTGKIIKFSLKSSDTRNQNRFKFADLSDSRSDGELNKDLTPYINMQLYFRIEKDYTRAGTGEQKIKILRDFFIFSNNYFPAKKMLQIRYDVIPCPAQKSISLQALIPYSL